MSRTRRHHARAFAGIALIQIGGEVEVGYASKRHVDHLPFRSRREAASECRDHEFDATKDDTPGVARLRTSREFKNFPEAFKIGREHPLLHL